jgi:hypothetical protein
MTVFSIGNYPTPQAAVDALQAAGGGKLYVPSMYNLSAPLVISGLVPAEIEGDGDTTGFNYNGAPANNVIQIGGDTYAANIRVSNLQISQSPAIANTPVDRQLMGFELQQMPLSEQYWKHRV